MRLGDRTTAQIVAGMDIILACAVFCYLVNLFFQPVNELVPSHLLSHTEKLARMVLYASINFSSILAQFAMGIKLFLGASKMYKDPVYAMRAFKWWGEWSVIHLLLSVFFASLILLMMEFSVMKLRKTLALGIMAGQILFRLIGLMTVGNINIKLEDGVQNAIFA